MSQSFGSLPPSGCLIFVMKERRGTVHWRLSGLAAPADLVQEGGGGTFGCT